MCGLLALLFIAIPALEIYALIEIGGQIGALNTLAIIVATGLLGAALARHQGLAALREVQRALATGAHVGRSVVEALLVLVASVLLLTPGFFTDAFGFAMLVPPLRRLVAGWLATHFAGRAQTVVMGGSPAGWSVHTRGEQAEGRPSAGRVEPDDHDPPPPGVIDV